ncbi:phosphoribosylanthranilate isomerase [Acidobacteria bacterium AH-259-L09]|nr:phosphoribosylanthranilate isomerase [Acidobacteria bacterium AH-259-L09]
MSFRQNSRLSRAETFLIKVCGITNLDDAFRSIDSGANALGFNFYPKSPRYIDPVKAEKITQDLPNHVLTVAVMVVRSGEIGRGEPTARLNRTFGARPRFGRPTGPPLQSRRLAPTNSPSPFGAFQLHGLQSASEIPDMDKRIFIATSPTSASRFPNHEILIDISWGTGKKADWGEVAKLRRPFILSGGLTAENVAEAIELLHPAGVDVCSGVERSPGVKDATKLKRFVENVRGAAGPGATRREQ